MTAPHLPAEAYLALLDHGRACASIIPADVRPQAARTLAAFQAEMLRGMAPQQPNTKETDHAESRG